MFYTRVVVKQSNFIIDLKFALSLCSLLITSTLFGENYTLQVISYFTKECGAVYLYDPKNSMSASQTDREILIQFSEALNDKKVKNLGEDGKEWLSSVLNGYDTLLIKSQESICPSLQADPHHILITFSKIEKIDFSSQKAWKLAWIRWLLDNYEMNQALSEIYALKECYPDDYAVQLIEASAYEQMEEWQRAVDISTRALMENPEDEEWKLYHNRVLFDRSPSIRLEREIRYNPNVSLEQIDKVFTQWYTKAKPCSLLYTGLDVEKNRVRLPVIQRSNGEVEGFKGDRYRMELYLRNECVDGDIAKGSLYFNEKLPGLGGTFIHRRPKGSTSVWIELNKPFWGTEETLVDFGNIYRIDFEIRERISRLWAGSFGGGLHHYSIDHVWNAASSIYLTADFERILFGINPRFKLLYFLIGEYAVSKKELINDLGQPYNPVPLITREDHNLGINIEGTFGKYWTYSGFAGYTFNRLGTEAPAIDGRLIYRRGRFEGLIEAGHYTSTTDNEIIDVYRAYLKWIY